MARSKPSKKEQQQDLDNAAWGAASFIPHVGPLIAGVRVAKTLYDSDFIQENMAAREEERRRRGRR